MGNDQDVTLTHIADTGLLLNVASELQFRDSDLKVHSSADGQLDIDANTEIEIATTTLDISATTIDVNGDIDLVTQASDIDLIDNNSSAISFDANGKAGILEIITTNSSESVNMSGDIDVNGTANLDIVDIDGAMQLDATLTVGTDGSGQDVVLYSGTAGDNLTWDASEEVLIVTGTDGQTAVNVADGNLVVADVLDANGSSNFNGIVSLDGSSNELRFYEGSNYVGFEAPSLSGDQIWVLPTADGSSDQVLSTNGSGTLSWSDVSATTVGTLTGASPLVLEGSTSDDFETTLSVTDPTADRILTFPNVNGTFLTTGNMSSITTTGTVTSGEWTGTAIADAYVANDLTISGGSIDNTVIGASSKAAASVTSLNANGTVSLDGSSNELRFYEGSNYVGFEAPSLGGDQIWVLPASDGTSNQVLSTNGSGTLSWATTSSSTVTITDNENTSENNALVFTSGGNQAGGTFGLESDGDATYNPSTGIITATGFNGSLTGTLQTAAQGNVTSLGTLTTLTVDNITTNGTTIGHTDDLDLMTLTSGNVTFTGTTVLPGVDINGGAIDGATIGANSPGTAIFSSVDVSGGSGVTLSNDETITNSVDGTVLINGELSSGTGSGAGVFKSNGNQDVTLKTGNGTTGSITIVDGGNQNISISPNGSGSVIVSTDLDIEGSGGLILQNDETITNTSNGTIDITAATTKLSGD